MKNLLLTFLTLGLFQVSTIAQMDDKFYYPSKKWELTSFENVNIIEKIYISDKDTLNAVLLKPKLSTPKATIIYFHGSSGNVSTYVKYISPLVNSGYQVFMIDFRGYGKSTGKPTHNNIANDAEFVFSKLLKDANLTNQKIIFYGSSMGTQVACNLAKKVQNNIVGLVLDGCISSLTDIALQSMPEKQREAVRPFLNFPYAAKEDVKLLDKIKVLFIHSKEDKDVPFSQYEEVLKNSKGNNFSWIYVGQHLDAPLLYPGLFVKEFDKIILK